jgi:hypothetical protein
MPGYFPILLLFCSGPMIISGAAQTSAATAPIRIGDVTADGSLRTRVESWDWFTGNADNDYTFVGSILRLSFSESRKTFDWQLELALPFLLALPNDAIAPGAQGQLGFGANYFAANNATNAALLFPKQGFVRFNDLGGVSGQSLKLGRMEYFDGAEVAPKDPTLAALKRDRIRERLIGNFGYSDVQRSFDGFQYVYDRSRLNFTLLASRPTRGVFQVDGWGELNINVFYGALTGQLPRKNRNAEWRIFGIGYNDYRSGVAKTDNRPLAVRTADTAISTSAPMEATTCKPFNRLQERWTFFSGASCKTVPGDGSHSAPAPLPRKPVGNLRYCPPFVRGCAAVWTTDPVMATPTIIRTGLSSRSCRRRASMPASLSST